MALSINSIEFPSFHLNKDIPKTRFISNKSSKVHVTNRPKSSPIKLNPDGIETFYLSARCQTANKNERNGQLICGRNNIDEISNLYKFPVSRPTTAIRNVVDKEAPNTTCDVYNLGPGYVIYRSGAEFDIRIDSDEFYGNKKQIERKEVTKRVKEDQKDLQIKQLQEQVTNLTVFLEEEKMNHNLSAERWQEEMDSTMLKLDSLHNRKVEDLCRNQRREIERMKEEQETQMKRQQDQLNDKIDAVHLELISYKSSFESYRQSLVKETEDKYELQKMELSNAHRENLEMSLEKQKRILAANYAIDLERVKEEHASEISEINRKHTNQIEHLNKRFADAAALEERLSQTIRDLARVRRDYTKLHDDYDENRNLLASTRKELVVRMNENESLKSELQEFSDRFEERVKRVDDDYKQKMDSLQNQIVEIRRAYVSKCEELVAERKQIDTKLHGRVETAKNVMKEIIHTRQRARISLVSIANESDIEEYATTTYRRRSDEFRLPYKKESISRTSPHMFSTQIKASTQNATPSRPSSAPITDKDEVKVLKKSVTLNQDRY